MNNRLVIAGAGSGKTTFLTDKALGMKDERVLITTYTEANRDEIERKIIAKCKCIPSRIKVQTWFSFLLQHGVRPYQGSVHESLYEKAITGMILNNGEYGCYPIKNMYGKCQKLPYNEKTQFEKHYFVASGKMLSDRLPKFVVRANTATKGEIVSRICRQYSHIFIDEVQDLAGYDLEILKLLFQSDASILLVGDPRQVTYLTHHEAKHRQYRDGRIMEFVQAHCAGKGRVDIDEATLQKSHRNSAEICEYSSRLYSKSQYLPVYPCDCAACRSRKEESDGVYLVKDEDVKAFLKKYTPVQLRWSATQAVDPNYPAVNMGDSKGRTYDHVLIYPTSPMREWVNDNEHELKPMTRAKFYVAMTRARYCVGIVSDSVNGLRQGILREYNQR